LEGIGSGVWSHEVAAEWVNGEKPT